MLNKNKDTRFFMKSNVFLIRASKNDIARLAIQIENFKKYNVDFYIIEENYNEPLTLTHFKSSNHLVIGPDYLKNNQLNHFPKVGWQCGDYIAYAGYSFFPNYDFYWVVDSDLYLNIDMNKLLQITDQINLDCLALDYDIASNNWYWYQSLASEYKDVYRMLYCLIRLSKPAVKFLKDKRSAYHPRIDNNQYHKFANDECFTATVLTNEGFLCGKIQNFLPQYFKNQLFSLNNPFYLEELNHPYATNQIIHPICDAERYQDKLKPLLAKNQLNIFTDKTYRLFCHVGEERCKEITGFSFLEIYKKNYNSDSILNLFEFSKIIKERNLPNVEADFFWRSTIYVINFSLKKVVFGVDFSADGSVYIVARNYISKIIMNKYFGCEKFCAIKQIKFINKDINIILKDNHIDNVIEIIFWFFSLIDREVVIEKKSGVQACLYI